MTRHGIGRIGRWTGWALAGVIAALPGTPLHAASAAQAAPAAPAAQTATPGEQEAAAAQAAVRQEALGKVRARRTAIAGEIGDALAGDDQSALAAARAAYRQAVSAELLLETAGLDAAERARLLQERATAAAARNRRVRQAAKDYLVDRLASADSDAAREQIFDSAADLIETARAEMEMSGEALRRIEPTVYLPARDRDVNRTQERMRELLDRISNNYVEEPLRPSYGLEVGKIGGAPQEVRDAEYWLRQREREADVAEYVRLARGGIFVDPSTGQPIEGTERQRIGRNAETQLAEALRRADLDEGVLANLMGFADTRVVVAGEREADIAASDEYRALDFITPSLEGAKAQEIFRALGLSVRREQDRINAWRAARVPEGGEGGVDGWLYENFVAKQTVGLGRASEIGDWGLTKDSLEQIDRRIAFFQRDADAVVAAFDAASRVSDPKDLLKTVEGSRQHRLLERYGYIARGSDGSQSFRIPTDARVSGRLARDLNLPGSSWLDIISGANLMKLVVLAAAPELAAARFGLLLESLELGAGAVRIGVIVSESLAGTALDAGINLATGERVDVEKLAIESLFLAPVIQGASRVAGEAGTALAALLKDRGRRQAAETFLTQSLGLASETALQTYWQAHLQGTVTYEDFLSNLVNGAISRGARGALDRVGPARSSTVDAIRGFRRGRQPIPEGLEPVFAGPEGRSARRETVNRAEENQKQFDEAVRQLREVVGDDLAHPDAPLKIVEALERGNYAWADLKMLYRNDPERLRPLMAAANEARGRFAESIVSKARVRAREQIEAEYRDRTRRLTDALKDQPDTLREALAQAEAWRQQQLDLVEAKPFAPGSDDLTSDIDRSVASPYVRNALKQVTDAMLGADGAPPTSARAYDLNEYIDVFPVIRRTQALDLTRQSPPDYPELTHQQGVEAIAMSSAMLHMSPAQRAQFRENALASATGDQLATLKLQFGLAELSLRRGEQELKAEIDRLVAAGGDRTDIDLVTRARDNLYGERTQRLHDLEYQLSRVTPDSDEAKRLAAEIEREWSFALREGIETYSSFSGLDVIVVRGQLQKRSIRDLINDEGFTAQALGMSPEQTRAMLHDQTLMIVEHVRAFHEGHEPPADAASALGKYAERAVLALKLTGADLSSGAAAELNRISELLVRARKDPDQLREQLETFGNGSADQGVQNLIALVERAVPGLEGLFDPNLRPRATDTPDRVDVTTPEGMARARALLALQRERDQERERERVQYGTGAVALSAEATLARDRAELADLEAEKARTDRLRSRYRRADWPRVEQLESERASITRQIDLLPNQQTGLGVFGDLRQRVQAIDRDLAALAARRGNAGEPLTDDEFVRERRIAVLRRNIPEAAADVTALQREAEEDARAETPIHEQARSALDSDTSNEAELARLFLGSGIFGDPNDRPKHEPIAPAVTPRAPEADAPPPVTRPRTGTTGAAPDPPGTGTTGGGGFTPTESVPPIDFEIGPGHVVEEESRTAPPDAFDLGIYGGGAMNADWFADAPVDHTTQKMISIVDLLDEVVVLADGSRPGSRDRRGVPGDPAPTGEALPGGPFAGDIWLEPISAATSDAQETGTPSVKMFVTSLGTSTGEAFTVHIVNDGDRPIRIRGRSALVLEPLAASAAPAVQQMISNLPATRAKALKATGYCLEFLRKPPTAGMVFRIASEELAERFGPLKSVLDAALRLEKLGLLTPDSSPAAYFHAIRQWAIWTKEQGFDLTAFGKAFVERTKKNFEELGQTWTTAIEGAVMARVPGRWADIAKVLEEAARMAGSPRPDRER